MRFLDNEANRIFLTTLLLLAGASLVASVTIGIVVSVRASRRIAGAVTLLRSDIHSIESRAAVSARTFVIAELTEISRSLEKLSVLLANEENYKRQWMQDIAHDLRTPISGLKGQLEGMRDGVLSWSSERLEKNLAEVGRLQELVNGIGELYAMENTDAIITADFSSAQFIDEVLVPHEMTKSQKHISVHIVIDVDTIRGDRGLLLRAVGNIVSNAFTYVEPGGNVKIMVRRNQNRTMLEVTDDGPGIPTDQIDKIFHRFFRGEYARNASGTGLGLNITKAIVERHEGEITVENRSPTGARFVISLPAR
jgi:two-component system sensor histidine kinase BaeS